MSYKDLREFMVALEKHGEINKIKAEVDWNMEFGAIARKSAQEGAPSVFAEKIKGYPEGYSMFAGTLAGSKKGGWMPFRRIALAFGKDPDTEPHELLEQYIHGKKNPIKPVEVPTGPCKENIMLGDDVDLYKFPAPMVHGGDGGRYIASWHATITKDPDTGWVNWGMYRAMIINKNKLAGLFIPYQHHAIHYHRQYEARGNAMPFAIAIGGDPLVSFIASSSLPAFVNEVDVAGGIKGEPIELVKCETNDLLVPAGAEIVIEGEVRPHERTEEGPFGEFTGFRTAERGGRPMYRVKAITHRNNPIMATSCMGMPCDDYSTIASISKSAELLDALRSNDIPVHSVCVHPWGVGFAAIVSTDTPYANIVHQIAANIWAHKAKAYWVIAVSNYVNPWNLEEVFHAIFTQCNPKTGVQVSKQTLGMTLDPFLNAYDRAHGLGASVTIDATFPTDWSFIPIPVSFENPEIYPVELQEKVKSRWVKDYGFKK